MTENDVIETVCGWLQEQGFKISQKCNTQQQGVDVVATRAGETWMIEAKGGTSSKRGSRRYGQPFSNGQLKDHVCKAFYAAAKLRCDNEQSSTCISIALPRSRASEMAVTAIGAAIRKLDISVLWIEENRSVTHWEGAPT